MKTTTTDPNQTPEPVDPAVAAAEQQKKVCGHYQRRIQQATFRISEKARSGDRAMLDRYIRIASPQMARSGESEFPTALRRHPLNADRHSHPIMPSLLFFHVANAIRTFFDLVLHPAEVNADELESRVKLLEQIAAKGVAAFRVLGTDREGYTLIHKDETPIPFSTKSITDDDRETA